jgi:hypothetical protein
VVLIPYIRCVDRKSPIEVPLELDQILVRAHKGREEAKIRWDQRGSHFELVGQLEYTPRCRMCCSDTEFRAKKCGMGGSLTLQKR